MRDTDWSHVAKFLTPLKRTSKIHSNFVFRFSFCGLSESLAASSVGVSVDQVHCWDDGEFLPEMVRNVWLYESGSKLPISSGFEGFSFSRGRIITPDGAGYTPDQLRYALFLLDQCS